MLLWSIVGDLFLFAACVFRSFTIKWNADLNGAEDFWVSLPSGCRLPIVLCVWVSCLHNCTHVYQAPVPLACHAYSIKLWFVQKSLIRSLVTCWRCFPFNTPGFYPCQCQKRERCSFSQPHTSTSTPHCTCIKTHNALKTYTLQLNIITNTAQIQIPMNPHKLTHTEAQIHTLVVLSLLLVLTAHQSPVSACRNMLTPAISLKSLSIRSSCAGPSTLCKPRVRNPPTYTHMLRTYTQTSTCVCTQMRAHSVCLHTYAYTLLA